jgi:hypothetical protein
MVRLHLCGLVFASRVNQWRDRAMIAGHLALISDRFLRQRFDLHRRQMRERPAIFESGPHDRYGARFRGCVRRCEGAEELHHGRCYAETICR